MPHRAGCGPRCRSWTCGGPQLVGQRAGQDDGAGLAALRLAGTPIRRRCAADSSGRAGAARVAPGPVAALGADRGFFAAVPVRARSSWKIRSSPRSRSTCCQRNPSASPGAARASATDQRAPLGRSRRRREDLASLRPRTAGSCPVHDESADRRARRGCARRPRVAIAIRNARLMIWCIIRTLLVDRARLRPARGRARPGVPAESVHAVLRRCEGGSTARSWAGTRNRSWSGRGPRGDGVQPGPHPFGDRGRSAGRRSPAPASRARSSSRDLDGHLGAGPRHAVPAIGAIRPRAPRR